MFLATKTTDRFQLVFSKDPAVIAEDDGWIPLDKAEIKPGESPDVFTCRPLNGDECLRILTACGKDPTFLVFAAHLGVEEIDTDGSKITEESEIQKILKNAQNMEAVHSLANSIFQVSREGLEVLPFRNARVTVE